MENSITAPVLLIAFNRPDTTIEVFKKIREAKPSKLYIAVDGYRSFKKGEQQLVEQVISIVQEVDWQCEKHFRFNEVNLGAEINVSTAISWVLEKEEYVIILEDDIVAPISFFKFTQEMLIKYKNENKIWAISGVNFTPLPNKNGEDYFFSKYGHTWGWATWRRVWSKFNLNTEIEEKHLTKKFLRSITNTKKELYYFKRKFERIRKNGKGNSTWDNIASYIHRTNNWLYIVPRVNLISNIGIQGLHAKRKTKYHYTEYDENFVVKKHPNDIVCNIDYDKYHFQKYIDAKPFIIIFLYKIMKLLKR